MRERTRCERSRAGGGAPAACNVPAQGMQDLVLTHDLWL
jgi:hypothetical protein